jgi:outer membrane biosynthesis protein TonB
VTRRSLVLIIAIGMFVTACASGRPAATSSSTPPALVAAPETVPPTVAPVELPTEAPPTKKPRKTKKPKPTPTPETWSKAYRSHVCAAITYLDESKTHVDGGVGRVQAGDAPGAKAEGLKAVALAVQASGEIGAAAAWSPGDTLKGLLSDSASTISQGASHWLDGLAAINFGAMDAAQAEMALGADKLSQAKIAVGALETTYGPAGC